jgi:hypothetical protein
MPSLVIELVLIATPSLNSHEVVDQCPEIQVALTETSLSCEQNEQSNQAAECGWTTAAMLQCKELPPLNRTLTSETQLTQQRLPERVPAPALPDIGRA